VVEPVWVRWVFTTVLAGITVTCLIRLVVNGRRGSAPAVPGRHDDIAQAIMGVSMIAMVLSWTTYLPTPLWVMLFGAQAVGFGALLLSRPAAETGPTNENWDYTHHVVASVAMVYMIVTIGNRVTQSIPAMAGMPGMTAAAMPTMSTSLSPLAWAFGVYFLFYAGWSLLRAVGIQGGVPVAAGAGGTPSVLTRPILVEGCRALMGGSMAYLLLAS
jgi:hypothetical protein